MLELKDIKVVFNKDSVNEKIALDGLSLMLNDGDFVSVIGSNGAGKSTLLNVIAGSVYADEGYIFNNNTDITFLKEYKRAKFIGRLFQDPLKGSAPSMSVEENLSLAYCRGKGLNFKFGINKKDKNLFIESCKTLGIGLENRMTSEVGLLSGGQRQALALLMATINIPDILLLDEHTAALDPKTSIKIMDLTNKIVLKNKITTLMITHNIENALKYGNKTIVMDNGKIIAILEGEERSKMNISDILKLYNNSDSVISDKAILG